MSVLFSSAAPGREAEARVLEADATSICAQLPAFKEPRDYTLKTWPANSTNVGKAGADVIYQLGYFGEMVDSDKSECDGMSASGALNIGDTIHGTLLWHFGNASQALGEYQKSVQMAMAAPVNEIDARDEFDARLVQAEVTSICAQFPAFKAAYDYTLKTWHISANSAKTTVNVRNRLLYFGRAVARDTAYCEFLSAAQEAAQPELVRGTFLWHFGNASQALSEYQAAVK